MTGSMIADYPHTLAGHCGSGSMRDLLGWAGLSYGDRPMGEGTVFGLSGTIAFTYLRGPGLGTPIYLVGRGPTLTEQLCDRLGIGHELRCTDDPAEGWTWVRDELDDGRPVLCWAEMAELPYLRVTMRMSRHDIVVTGYDTAAGTVTIVDNDREQPQTIGLDDLARARSAQGFPMPTRHACYRLRFPEQLPEIAPVAAGACIEAAAGLGEGVGLPRPVAASVLASGTHGVRTFVDDLEGWDDLFCPDELARALTALRVFIDKAGTGGALFRRLQWEFLTDLADQIPTPQASAARDGYARVAEAWSAVAAATRGDDRAGARLSKVRAAAAGLPELEANGEALLRELAASLGG